MSTITPLPRPLSAQADLVDREPGVPVAVWLAMEVAGDPFFVVVDADGLVSVVRAMDLRIVDETLRLVAHRTTEILEAASVGVPA